MNGSKYAPSMVFLFLINDLHSWHFVNCIILTYYEVHLGYTLKLSDVLFAGIAKINYSSVAYSMLGLLKF